MKTITPFFCVPVTGESGLFKHPLSSRPRGRHLRHWRVLLDQILRFEIRPELGGDLRLHGSVIRKDLLFAFAAHHQGRGNIGCCRELQSGGSKVYSMIGRHIQKLSPLFNKGCRNLIGLFSIVIARAPERNPALSEEPITKETFFALAAGNT